MKELQPINENVLLDITEKSAEVTTAAGIIIPDTAKEKPQRGVIIAIGPGRLDEEGKRIPMEVKKGDKVIYSKYAGSEIKQDDKEVLILRESDILAKYS